MSASIPQSFFPALKTFAEFSRKKVRINTIGNTVANPGELVQILLLEGKIDLSTFSLGGYLTTTTGTGSTRAGPVQTLIEQVLVEVGSLQMHPNFNYFGHVWNMFQDLQGDWNKSGINSILNLTPTSSNAIAANQTSVPFQLNRFIGFLNDVKILNTDRLPPVRISFRLAQPNVLASSAGATTPSFQLTQLYALVDMVKLSPVYDELLTQRISQSPIQIPYQNFQVIPCAQGTLTSVNRFSSTVDALERAYATFVPTTYQAPVQTLDTTTFQSTAFTRGGADIATLPFNGVWTINGMRFGEQPAYNERGEILLQTLQTINEDHDITCQPHPNLNSLANFSGHFFAHGVNWSWNDEDSTSRKCGLSSLGQNLQGSYETSSTGSNVYQPLLIIQSKAMLEVGSGRVARVLY